MKIVMADPAKLKPYPGNPRVNDAAVEAVSRSIREFGFRQPIVVDKKHVIVIGHTRCRAAVSLGLKLVPVHIASELSEDQLRALRLADNRLGELAEWDDAKLAAEIGLLAASDYDLGVLAFDDATLASLMPKETPTAGSGDEPPADVVRRAKANDLWLIGGKHRLLVADCNDTASTVRLAIPEDHVTILDPPFEAADHAWQPHLTDPCILFGQGKHLRAVSRKLYRFERIIDKVKAHRSATVQVGHRHAFVVQCGTVKKCPTTKDTFDSIIRAEHRPDHPHEKPVSLIVEHLTAWTPDGPVWEPFAGSGAGLIASHRTGRTWCGCERSTEFADVILRRAEAEGMVVEKIQAVANE